MALAPNCSSAGDASDALVAGCNCSVPTPLPGLHLFLNDPRGKGKFLTAFEHAIKQSDICIPGKRMLDIGSGAGELTRWLGLRCGLCTKAYDLMPAEINKYNLFGAAHQHNLSRDHVASFQVWPFDGAQVPEADRSFELTVLNSMLHHAATNATKLLREAARLTTRHALVLEDLALNNSQVMERHRIHDDRGIFRSWHEWTCLFDEAGFRVVATGALGASSYRS